jgi:hypothetical protein
MADIRVNFLDIQDASGSPDLTWYVNPTSVDSGNNFQVYFFTKPVSNVQITGSGLVSGSAVRTRTSLAFVNGSASAVAIGSVVYNSSAQIEAFGTVTASGVRQGTGTCFIIVSGEMSAKGIILGEEWSDISVDPNTWTDVEVSTNIWTDKNIGNNTWL